MKLPTRQQILKRRMEIEKELLELLKKTESDFGLEDIRDIIYNEDVLKEEGLSKNDFNLALVDLNKLFKEPLTIKTY